MTNLLKLISLVQVGNLAGGQHVVDVFQERFLHHLGENLFLYLTYNATVGVKFPFYK